MPSFDRDRFKKVQPKVVTLHEGEVVQRSYLAQGQTLPLVLQPAAEEVAVDIAEWAEQNRAQVEEDLRRHGAILFRGFGITEAAAFERLAQSVCTELFQENGEHPRETVDGNVYTPTFYPADQKLLWHNENSFNHSWPSKILFCCVKAPERGGETPIVDSRQVIARLDPAVREKFMASGVTYMRNYHAGLGLSWQEVFQVQDPLEVERQCREDRIDFDWLDGRLRTRATRPAAVRHPQTGEETWFNQAQHWHVSCLDPETRQSLAALYPEGQLPRNCYYGDGSPIQDEEMRHILDVYDELEVSFPWQRGDALLVDNLLVAHARNPYVGERKLLVSLGDMLDYDRI